jgi:hypothetical protein
MDTKYIHHIHPHPPFERKVLEAKGIFLPKKRKR